MIKTAPRIETLVLRIQGEFLDTPSLRLTLPAAARRFGIDRVSCKAVLGALVDASVLARTSNGAYVRLFPRLARAA